MLKQFDFGFGEQTVTFSVAEKQIVDVIEGKSVAAITDVREAVQQVLRSPIGTAPLDQVIAAGDTVAVIVSDLTRAWVRHDLFLPPLFDELNRAGVPDQDIKLVVALGAHRRNSDAENLAVYGEEVVRRVTIEQSCALDEEGFVPLGKTSRGVVVEINRHVAEADKVILTGGIVYHSMAGFSAGRKAVLPGVSSYASIQGNHSFCLHEVHGQGISPNSDSGILYTNPMHLDQMEITAILNPAFLLNAVFTPDGGFACFVAGHWRDAWLEGCKTVQEIYGVPITRQADITVASSGGFPKDINFYQASKGIENAYGATRPGGIIIGVMECRDIYDPPDFSQWFDYVSLYDREMALRQGFTVPGFVALKMGIVAKTVTVIMVTLEKNKEFFAKAGILTAATIDEAFALASEKLGTDSPSITIMPHAATTVPILKR